MENLTITLSNENVKPEFIYIIYGKDSCYIRECKTLSEVAKYFKTTKQAISNHLRRTRQEKSRFTYKEYSIEYFDINGIY
jgi:hypothetical protein